MKKSVSLVIAVVLAAGLVPSTLSAAVGFKGGVAWSNLRFNYAVPPSFSLENRKEYVIGMFFGLGLPFITIQPEVLYLRMGGQTEGSTIAYRIDYVQVPLLVKLNILPAGPIKPCIFAGPYGSVLISAHRLTVLDGSVVDVTYKDHLKSTDSGLVFGAGIDFNLALVKLTLDARYCLGLANIDKLATSGDSLKNKAVVVMAGIGF